MPLLRGIDGSAKISKSEGNIVGLTGGPEEMFGKIMSIPDVVLPIIFYWQQLLNRRATSFNRIH